jgi:sigma-B regulation protein RsbU (phosphoserine phosphatase)
MGEVMRAVPNSILVVDDEELNSEALARRLKGHDYEVTIAKSGRQAIELLGERRFELVLLDIMMPGMSGLEVLKFLRRVESLIELPIIMVTAKGESEDLVEALELGANDYVTKPLDFPVVLARIRAQLALSRAVSQVTELERQLSERNKELEATAAALAAANERLMGDLVMAARVQQALLPALPPEVPGARFAWTFKPCGQLASDFLNVFRLDERHLGLCVLDVSGHGVAGALLAVASSHLLARLASALPGRGLPGPRDGTALLPPAQVAGQLSKHFAGGALGQPFMLLYGILDLDTGEFRFVSAGHPGPVHVRRGAAPVRLETSGLPVGVGTASYDEQAVNLRPGDRLVFYTDGATEARNKDGEHFGIRRLLAALEQSRRSPLDKSLDALVESVEAWRGDAPRHHDLLILSVERPDPAGPEGAAAAEPTQLPREPSCQPSQHHPGKHVP